MDCCNILHINGKEEETLLYGNPDASKKGQEVVSLDGVFLCARKTVWSSIRFDENQLDGFHLYDIDFSVRASKHYKLLVTYQVHMLHLTEGGNFGNSWVDNTVRWHRSRRRLLPAMISELNNSSNHEKEFLVTRSWLLRLRKESISLDRKLVWIFRSGAILNTRLWPAILVFFVFRALKKVKNFLKPKKLHYIPQ